MRAFQRTLRVFSVITLFFFCWTFLPLWQAVAYAATPQGQGAGGKGPGKQGPGSRVQGSDDGSRRLQPAKEPTINERFEKALDSIRENITRAGDKSDKGEDDARERETIKAKRADIESADFEFKKEFAATEKKLRDAKFPKDILDRHAKFVKHYEDNLKELRANLDDIEQAKTTSDRRAKIEKARLHLDKVKAPSKHKKLDPNNLPFKARKAGKKVEPRLKKEQFEKDFLPQKSPRSPRTEYLYEKQFGRKDAQEAQKFGLELTRIKANNPSRLTPHPSPILVASNGPLIGLLSSDSKPETPALPFSVHSEPALSSVEGSSAVNDFDVIRHSASPLQPVNASTSLLLAQAVTNAPTADDLLETPDVQFTDVIRAKAQELGKNPVRMYEWVRNNIEFVPTYGSIQGADMCLQSKICNDADTASLLIALLRTSNISARYVYGTIEIPIDKLMNWAGGFTDPDAAIRFISAGGTPITPVMFGGVITAVQMEHVSVDAWIDYFPSRGARHKVGNTWIQLDASFKQYSYAMGIDIRSSVPLDSQAFLQQRQSSAIINEPESSAMGVDCSSTQQSIEGYQVNAENYLNNQHPGASVGDVLGKKHIIKQEFPYLLGTLPYKTVVVGQKMSELPDTLRHTVELVLSKDNVNNISIIKGLPEVVGHKITLGYVPATQADIDVINKYMPKPHSDGTPITLSELPASLPAYLINVKSELRIDGELIATGAPIGLGQEETLTTTFTAPGQNTDTSSKTIEAGEYYAIAVDTGRGAGTLSSLFAKLEATKAKLVSSDISNLTREDILGDVLYTAASSYFGELDTLNVVQSKTAGVTSQRLPSAFIASTFAKVDRVFGMPLSMSMNGLAAESTNRSGMIQALNGDNNKQKQFLFSSGLEASALIGAAGQGLFAASGTSAITPVSAIAFAKDQGIPVYTINQSNRASILPKLQQADEVMTDIQNAVNAGLVVVAPQKNVAVGAWSGSGYLIIDPATGDVEALMTGGVNGAVEQGPAWISKSAALGLPGSLSLSLIDLSSNIVSSDFMANLKAIAAGVSDVSLSVAKPYLPLIMSGYFLQTVAENLSCYLDPASITTAPPGPCMADLLGGLCIANNISVISTSNTKPVANAGQDRTVNIGDLVSLDGTGSFDADNDPLTYNWTLLSKPDKSSAALYNTNLPQLSFVADVAGTYKIRLIVSDGKSYSNPADVTITAGYTMVDVPNLSNKTQQNAELAIIAAGLRVGAVTLSTSDTITPGSVMSQKPQTPAILPKGSTVDITVSSGPATDTEPPTLDVQFDRAPPVYYIPESVIVTIHAADNSGTPSVTAKLDGAATTVTLPDTPISTATFTAGSNHTIEITATDSSSNKTTKTLFFGIADSTKTTPPDINIITPAADAELSAPTAIIGTVTTPNLMQYTLSYAPVGTSSFIQFSSGTTPITNGTLGTIDPTLLKNGIYDVRLTATDTNGTSTYMDVTYRVKGDMKVGNFTVTFTDLSIPVTGIPITVSRTYDSRDKGSHDFGIGWTVDIQNTKLDENRIPGEGWPQYKSGGAFGQYCLQGDTEHYVTVNLPDGRIEEFDMVLTPNCQRLAPVGQTSITYAARPGTTSTLALKNPKLLLVTYSQVLSGQLIDPDTGAPFNPSGYVLTTADGMAYDLDQNYGVKSVTDPNGNKLTYDNNGITHSDGQGVSFTRDSKGRITKITAPDSSAITYAYDADGNLASMTDQAGNVTKYSYNRSHGLTDIKDPRGITPVKNIYDDSGRLTAHIDAQGNRIEYAHDIAGRQEVVKDRNGNLTVYIYDEKGRVLQKTDPQGNTTSFTYDAVGNKLSETDPLGNTTSWTYDSKKNILTETRIVSGQTLTTSHTYNSLGKVLTTTDPMGHIATNTYDAKGNLLTTTDALGNATTNTYDTKGNILSTTDALNNTATYEYDGYGNRTKQTNAAGAVTTDTYDTKGNKLTETDPRGNTTTYTYDANGKLLTVTNAEGSVTKYEYDKTGNKVSETNALGLITWYYYDSANRLVETEFPDGTGTKTVYDNEGNRIASIDQEGRTTSYEYNGSKQLTKTTYADGSTRQFSYDSAGRQTTITDPLGNITTKVYDPLGRVIASIDPELNSTTFEYDANGNQVSQTDPNGHATTFAYDENNRLVTTTLPGGQATTVGYDALGRKTSETDAAQNRTRFDYDTQGNLAKVTDAAGGITLYEYDLNNNRTAIVDARNNRTTFAFDNLNRLISKTTPNGGIETYAYDKAGRQIAKTDAKGQTIQYAYDTNGRLSTRAYPDSTAVRFSYTDTGKRAAVTDKRGTTNYMYDNLNRLGKYTYPNGQSINYGYDATGRIAALSSSLTGTVLYSYYNNSRLKEVKDPQGNITSYSYDAAGSRTGLAYPNGTTVSYTYDDNNRLTNLTHKNSINNVMASYAYTLGAIGNRMRIDEANGISRQYTYDKLYRLTNETVTDPTNTQTYQNDFTYDAVGNRLNKTTTPLNQPVVSADYTYNAADQLISANSITYTYDLNGNLATKIETAGTTTYEYDYENRLVKVTTPSSTVLYQYDADGNRVSAGNSKYLVDTNRSLAQVLAEYSSTGTAIATYVYADDLIGMNRNGVVSYYHFDGLGSTRLLTDATGATTDTYDFDAFGNQIARTGTTQNEFLFTGQQYDANVGFYYLRARYYQPDTGRFTALDPFAGDPYAPMSLHKYLYAANDPVNLIDPTGMFADLGSMMVAISLNNTLSTIATPSASASVLGIPVLPSEKTRRQLVGLIYGESGTTEWGGENSEEKSAIGATVINRAYYATLAPASGHGTCYNQPGFGSGTIWSAITAPGEFLAYGGGMWNEVMIGDDMKSSQQLDADIRRMSKRLHLINSVSAANSLPSSPQLVELSGLGADAPISFNQATNSPPNAARMEKIGRQGRHTFYGFRTGRECQ